MSSLPTAPRYRAPSRSGRWPSDLASHGYAATEAASTSLEAETGERCNANGDLTLGWSDLRTLQSQYGWTITPRGNGDDRTLSTAEQTADSCDLLPTFASEGFNDAWSMYSYYGGPYSTTMQANVVAQCFAFGRTYRIGTNPLPVPSPYLVQVDSINGGNCGNTACPAPRSDSPMPTHSQARLWRWHRAPAGTSSRGTSS